MKTEQKYHVGQRWEHRKQGVVVEVIEVNTKAKTVTLEDDAGNNKAMTFSNLTKTYKVVEEEEKPAKKGKAKKEEAKPAKEKASKTKKAKAEKPEEVGPDPKFADIVKLMKDHNKKDPANLLSVVVVFASSNYPGKKYSEIQRSYRIFNNQGGLMPKPSSDMVQMFSLAGDDDNVDYFGVNWTVESAFVEVGAEDEELPAWDE